MLAELAVRDLGVIRDLKLVLSAGMTAVTGETGAGKTLIVEAIELLVGGRADGTMVRHGAQEATVEGRFLLPEDQLEVDEVVLRRVVPSQGRSRAYVDGRLATASELAEWGRRLVDLHGQHDHQSLLSTPVQRAALDRFGGIDLDPLVVARKALDDIDAQLAELGGDPRERARELDLLRFQMDELDEAGLENPSEDDELEQLEDALSDAVAHREALAAALAALDIDDGAGAGLARAVSALDGRRPFEAESNRLRGVAAEMTDIAADLRAAGEQVEPDPQRLDEVRARRRLLHELRRKYGDDLVEVMAYRDEVRLRVDTLADRDRLAAELDDRRAGALAVIASAEHAVGAARRAAAPGLAAATQAHLVELAMAKAVVEVSVGEDPGDDVTFLLAANAGSPPLPLSRVASGGELARTMLALRLVLSEAPPTLVFDEVDAGIGGTAATAVGRSLAALGSDHQVLVVTHLPQVAAFADAQVGITKAEARGAVTTSASSLDETSRSVELARMLSGSPDSSTARQHADELLADAAIQRGR